MKVAGIVAGALLFMLHASSGMAQSVITLEDFDLGSDLDAEVGTASEEPKSDLENCLLKSGSCASDELRSGASFSLDDVLNLGVIDHDKVAPAPVSAVSGDASTSASPSTYADPLPSVDMEILFDYDSADIRWDQKNRLIDLARTLSTDGFRGYSLLFVGHTDAKGSAQYNRHLSGQRAEAVADFIRVNTALPPHQIISSGIGFDKLKDRNDPLSPRNRRVQLVLVPLRK